MGRKVEGEEQMPNLNHLPYMNWVDWIKGDNNHLATITCHDKGLRYLHLPGFYENDETNKWDFFKKYNYNTNEGNLHTFNNKPFLIHRKGGTGLYRVMEKKR
jgi:protein tyrosine phosphatase